MTNREGGSHGSPSPFELNLKLRMLPRCPRIYVSLRAVAADIGKRIQWQISADPHNLARHMQLTEQLEWGYSFNVFAAGGAARATVPPVVHYRQDRRKRSTTQQTMP